MIERYGNLDSIDPLSYKKAQSVIYNQDCSVLMDSVEVCNFVSEWTFQAVTMKDIVELFQAVTGLDMGEKELIKAAVRIRDMERAYWVREGYTRKDDRMEGKLANQAVPDGPQKGEKIDPVKVEKMLDEYYQMRGWDVETGIPTRKRLLEDGLQDVVEDLEKRGIVLT
jgi:aldehyde:ferredoxin oxidoreductase